MNELILKEYGEDRIVYFYLPEGKGKPGKIVVDIASGETSIAARAQNDESGSYGHKAVRRVNEYFVKKNLPMKAIQAWY